MLMENWQEVLFRVCEQCTQSDDLQFFDVYDQEIKETKKKVKKKINAGVLYKKQRTQIERTLYRTRLDIADNIALVNLFDKVFEPNVMRSLQTNRMINELNELLEQVHIQYYTLLITSHNYLISMLNETQSFESNWVNQEKTDKEETEPQEQSSVHSYELNLFDTLDEKRGSNRKLHCQSQVYFPFLDQTLCVDLNHKCLSLFKKRMTNHELMRESIQNRLMFPKYLCTCFVQLNQLKSLMQEESKYWKWNQFLNMSFLTLKNKQEPDSTDSGDTHQSSIPRENDTNSESSYEEARMEIIWLTAVSLLKNFKGRTVNSLMQEIVQNELLFLKGEFIPAFVVSAPQPIAKTATIKQQKIQARDELLVKGHDMYKFRYMTMLEEHFANVQQLGQPTKQKDEKQTEIEQNEDQDWKLVFNAKETEKERRSGTENIDIRTTFTQLLNDHYAFKQYTETSPSPSSIAEGSERFMMSRTSRNQLKAATRRLKHILASPHVPNTKKQEAIANFNRLTLFV